jgi:hypothetical protein
VQSRDDDEDLEVELDEAPESEPAPLEAKPEPVLLPEEPAAEAKRTVEELARELGLTLDSNTGRAIARRGERLPVTFNATRRRKRWAMGVLMTMAELKSALEETGRRPL